MRFNTIKINIQQNNLFFTSDLHLDHENVIEYCERPFTSIDAMNQIIIDNWNSVVGKNDYVFIAGDFCFGKIDKWRYYLNKLNGRKYLAAGNHDKSIPRDMFLDVQHLFNIIVKFDDELESDGMRFTVCHYPMLSWYQSHRGSVQIFGHHHGKLSGKNLNNIKLMSNQLDVGVDVHDFYPVSYQQVKIIITKQNLK